MNKLENIIKEILIEDVPSLKQLEIRDFKDIEVYNNYINHEVHRYYNYVDDNKIRSIVIERIIQGLEKRNIDFKKYIVSEGYMLIKEIELL